MMGRERHLKTVDISNVPELLRLVEEVRATNEPRMLRRDSEDMAILMPAPARPKRRLARVRTKADYEASCLRQAVGRTLILTN